jgi:TRAP-type C4-dicarboxylate transport system substrate-binding protein
MQPITLNWVLAHEPYHVFIKAAKNFAQEVAEETQGQYQINVISLAEWNQLADQNLTTLTTDREKIIGLVDNGAIDLATVYANTLGTIDPDMYALSMPFLFRSHEQAQQVLDGKIGLHMLNKIADRSNIRGLAFTYSGGFRIVPSRHAIETLEDFYKMNIGCSNNPVSMGTFKSVGANPVPMFIEDLSQGLQQQRVDAGETTYTRYFVLGHNEQTSFINDNEHSLFLTSLIINKQLWQRMGERVQNIFAKAALAAAQIEREDSLNDNIVVQQKATAAGIPTVKMTEKELVRFESATQGMYNSLNTYFSAGLLDQLANGLKH